MLEDNKKELKTKELYEEGKELSQEDLEQVTGGKTTSAQDVKDGKLEYV